MNKEIYCKDCKHYKEIEQTFYRNYLLPPIFTRHICTFNVPRNLVTGEPAKWLYAETERSESGGCGPDANNYEALMPIGGKI